MKARKFISRKQNEKNKISIVIETSEITAGRFREEIRKAIRKLNRLVDGKLSFQVLVIYPDDKHQEV